MQTSPDPTQPWRALTAVLAVLALVVLGGPAAASTGSQPSIGQLQAREAAARVQLNLARASYNQVIAEVDRLQTQVSTEQRLVAADASALAAADASVADARQRLADLQASGDAAHRALVARAVYLYEHPYLNEQVLIDGAKTLDDITTRPVLANAVQGSTNDLIDAVRQQLLLERAASKDLAAAQAQAQARAQATRQEYGLLSTALSSREQVRANLAARISDYDGQIAGLDATIRARTAQQSAAIATVASSGATVIGPVGSFGLQWPIHGVVTQEFGHNGHPGIDIAAPYGTTIHASGSGVVIYAGWESGYGNYTCIAHGRGISTCYGHQSAIFVSVGQTVTRGQAIGAEGSTGYSTGPHVHFEVRVNGTVNNPRNFIPGDP